MSPQQLQRLPGPVHYAHSLAQLHFFMNQRVRLMEQRRAEMIGVRITDDLLGKHMRLRREPGSHDGPADDGRQFTGNIVQVLLHDHHPSFFMTFDWPVQMPDIMEPGRRYQRKSIRRAQHIMHSYLPAMGNNTLGMYKIMI